MIQEEKSLQRGAEWEQWGLRPWQATERSDRSGTSRNWNVEQMILGVLTHQRGFSGSLAVLLCSSHNLTVADIWPLLGLVSCQSGSISPAPAPALPASSATASSWHSVLPGTNMRNVKLRNYQISSTIYHPQSHCWKCFSFKWWSPTSNLQSDIPPTVSWPGPFTGSAWYHVRPRPPHAF